MIVRFHEPEKELQLKPEANPTKLLRAKVKLNFTSFQKMSPMKHIFDQLLSGITLKI